MCKANQVNSTPAPWRPTTFVRHEQSLDTSMGTARIVTDAGPAYIKALGNRQGPHPLACEWVATHLADWLGLPTFDCAIIEIDAEIDQIPFFRGGMAASGPAFVTRAASGHTWGGSPEELGRLVNPNDAGKLVVFDTWVKNCDRHPPDLTVRRPNYDNVFLEDVDDGTGSTKSRLVAMDHTHCFTCGRDLDERVAYIDKVNDDRLYGLFPGFKPRVRQDDIEAAIGRLSELDQAAVFEIVASIPDAWEVSSKAAMALVKLICRRADFVADTILKFVGRQCWPVQLFDNRQ